MPLLKLFFLILSLGTSKAEEQEVRGSSKIIVLLKVTYKLPGQVYYFAFRDSILAKLLIF